MNLRFSLVSLLVTSTAAFTTAPAFTSSVRSTTSNSNSNTELYISSWGTKGPPSRWGDTLSRENPAEKVAAYLKEPEAVEARNNVDGRVLVSGLLLPDDLTKDDQFLFDLLNHEDSAFEFEKIVAYSPDAKRAKKRLLSRSARYTGLLDKLEFVEGSTPLPSAGDLTGSKTWLAYLQGDDLLEQVKEVAKIAEQATSVENVALLLTGANELEVAASAAALDALKAAQTARADDAPLSYTLVAVGKLQDHPEGQAAYQFEEFGSEQGKLPGKAIFSRQESYRMVTELLQLECGVNKALCFAEVYNENATEYKLVKGLREAGYARPQEVDHMVRDGVAVS